MKSLSKINVSNQPVVTGIAAFLFLGSAMLCAQSKSYSQLQAEHPGWMQVPGRLIRPDCVHEVPSDAQIEFGSDGNPTGDVKLKGKVIAHYDSCPEESIDTRHLGSQGGQLPNPSGYGDGWVEASQWKLSLKSTDNIDSLLGYWYVPGPPAFSGALVFLFNGIESTGGDWIMQPVLQWGNNGNFGGDYYTFASWVVGPKSSGYVFYSSPIIVNPGDYLLGNTGQYGVTKSGLSYFVIAADTTTNERTAAEFTSNGLHWIWAFSGVLEAYNVTSCGQYPSPLGDGPEETHFRKTKVAHGYPAFDSYKTLGFYGQQYDYFGSGGPQCNFSVSENGTTSLLTY